MESHPEGAEVKREGRSSRAVMSGGEAVSNRPGLFDVHRPAPCGQAALALPAVHHDGAAEEVAESIHSPSQFEEQVRVVGHPVVRPAGELDMGHLPPS